MLRGIKMKQMKLVLTAAIMLSAFTAPALAAKADIGTSGAQFLKLGAGARTAGMGDAGSAVVSKSDSIYWNVGGLAALKKPNIEVMHSMWFEDISYQWVSFGMPTKIGVFGLAVQYLSYGKIDQTDDTGLVTSSFSPLDMMASLSYARKLFGVDSGLSVKYIQSKITNTATAYAADLGVRKSFMGKKLSTGLAIQNLGTKLKYIVAEEPLPMNIKAGAGYDFGSGLLAALDINLPQDSEIYYALGVEKKLKIKDFEAFGRLGYNTITKDIVGTKGIGIGLGLNYNAYSFDYAFTPYGELGNTHKISIGFVF